MGQGSSATISEDELQLLRNTMDLAMKDAEQIGVDILGRFLERYQYKSFFKKLADVPDGELHNNPVFRGHSLKVIKTIEVAISHADQFPQVKTDLFNLGKLHGSKKLSEQQFLELKSVILEYFDERFKLSPETVTAWEKAFEIGYPLLFEGLESKAK